MWIKLGSGSLCAAVLAVCQLAGSGIAAASTDAADVPPGAVGPVRVIGVDRTVDSCWTNLDQAEDYAEIRLEQNGFEVIAEEAKTEEGYVLYVGVAADRANGSCSGTVHILFARPTWADGEPGSHRVGPETSLFSSPKSANVYVLGKLRAFIDQL